MTPRFSPRTRLRAADLNELRESADSAHLGGASYLAADNGFEQVARNPRRQIQRGRSVASRDAPLLCKVKSPLATSSGDAEDDEAPALNGYLVDVVSPSTGQVVSQDRKLLFPTQISELGRLPDDCVVVGFRGLVAVTKGHAEDQEAEE